MSHRRPVLVSAAVLASLLASTVPAAAAGTAGRVAGRVVGVDGEPVAGVVVTVRTATDQVLSSATTAANGRYLLTRIAPGLRSLCVDGTALSTPAAPLGYALTCGRHSTTTAASAPPVTVVADRTLRVDDLLALQPAVVTGRVVDAAGRPLAGARVGIYDLGGARATTDAEGRYRVTEALRWGQRLDACADGLDRSDAGATYGYARGCSAYLDVQPGRVATATRIVLPARGALGGTVRDTAGRPVGGVTVTVAGGSSDVAVRTTADGRWTAAALTPGDTVTVRIGGTDVRRSGARFGLLPAPQAATVTVPAGARADGVDAVLAPAGAVRGVVRDSGGRPVGRVGVVVARADGSLPTYARTADDGSWQVTGVVPGEVTVCSTGRRNDYGTACLGGGADRASSSRLQVAPDGLTPARPVTVPGAGDAPGTGAFVGRVVDGHGTPVAQLQVNWQQMPDDPAESPRDGFRSTATDGSFAVDDIPVGRYRVCIAQRSETSPRPVPGFAPVCLPEVTVADRADTRLGDVVAPVGGAISGRVTDSWGYELHGWTMTVTDLATDEITLQHSAERTGAFTTDPLVPATYRVCVFGGSRVADNGEPAGGYRSQCFQRRALPDGTPVAVEPGQIHGGVDFRLPG